MITMCILNEGKESYDPLSTVPAKFSHELEQLKTDGYKDPNNIDLAQIDQNNWIIDELHLMLRRTYQKQKKDFTNNTQTLIIVEMKGLHIHCEFYPPTTKNGNGCPLWDLIRKADEEIDQFEADIKQWISDFCRPTIGNPNSVNQQVGIIEKKIHQQAQLFLEGGRVPKNPRNS
ncbi:hypothetical protein RclHR1_16150004 [Rhizophagus clarus]|uniref:Uncharacterized protein n=1 Tax=Rhizophagus clarus TaxID=94130 RepID=A0A2Z6QH12_9GLOM|nr:hypothetical protein RclHR1_16150004 [Rhizophagus clarus]